MLALVESGVFSLSFCALIAVVLALGWRYLKNERNHLAAINQYVLHKYRLGHRVELRPLAQAVVDDITQVEQADDPARRQARLDGLWKRAVRLEGSVDFWVDLLQKLGLLGTVLGLGFALALRQSAVGSLLEPLSMAVWTTVVGLVGSIAISWKFGRDVDVEVDACEDSLREWQQALAGADAHGGDGGGPRADTEVVATAIGAGGVSGGVSGDVSGPERSRP
ncbi:hypothetical protein [Haliangium sp.]|uniref:hypothetical protein n=1 Tax=Haliangium sp. TaxID=2663208 RepID=UPI003D14E045